MTASGVTPEIVFVGLRGPCFIRRKGFNGLNVFVGIMGLVLKAEDMVRMCCVCGAIERGNEYFAYGSPENIGRDPSAIFTDTFLSRKCALSHAREIWGRVSGKRKKSMGEEIWKIENEYEFRLQECPDFLDLRGG